MSQNRIIIIKTRYTSEIRLSLDERARGQLFYSRYKNTNPVQLYNGNVLKKAISDKVTDMVAARRKNVQQRNEWAPSHRRIHFK